MKASLHSHQPWVWRSTLGCASRLSLHLGARPRLRMITTSLDVPTPADFSFAATVYSHGWRNLPPFRYDEDCHVLSMPQRLDSGVAVVKMRASDDHKLTVSVESEAPFARDEKRTLSQMVRISLGLDQNIAEFQRFIAGIPGYEWMVTYSLGRLLASPSIWEDLAKTLATTNTTWEGTITMCERLVSLGDQGSEGSCFPTPEQIAAVEPGQLAKTTRLGYRAAYLHELATKIVNKELDVEAWRATDLPTDELYARLTALKGFGPYAAGNMLRLLGRHERLAIDSVVRTEFSDRMNTDGGATDRSIEAYYKRFGLWAGLVMWLDVMRTQLIPHLDSVLAQNRS